MGVSNQAPKQHNIEMPGDFTDAPVTDRRRFSPMRELQRGGTRKAIHPHWEQALVSIKVENAMQGYFYRLGYYGNGVLISGEANYGITVYKIPVDDVTKQQPVMSFRSSSSVVFDKTKGGVQTIEANGIEDPFTRISLTVDVDKLPPEGTQINSIATTHHGYNSIIDPGSYSYANINAYAGSDLHIEWDKSSGKLKVGYKGGTKWYRIIFARKSINNTFSILSFGYADAHNIFGELIPVEYAMWHERAESQTDWLSPVYVRAINEGDEGEPIYTSGSHGSDGRGGGEATADSILVQVYIDNSLLNLDKSTKLIAKSVTIISVNRVRGYNTLSSRRSILEEYFTFKLDGRGVHIHKRAVALEPIVIEADNGCQMTMSGLSPVARNSYLIFGSNQKQRNLMNAPFDSGPLEKNSKVFGVSIRHTSAGEFTGWIDPNFGVGKRDYVPSHLPGLRFRSTGKVYFRLFHHTAPLTLQAGESYEWRGGYYYGTPTKTEYFDTVIQVQDGVLLVKPDGSYVIA